MHQQSSGPGQRQQAQVLEGMAQPLQEPEAAVEGGEHPAMDAEVDDPLEVAIGGIGGVGGPVPADWHGGKEQGPQTLDPFSPSVETSGQLTDGTPVR